MINCSPTRNKLFQVFYFILSLSALLPMRKLILKQKFSILLMILVLYLSASRVYAEPLYKNLCVDEVVLDYAFISCWFCPPGSLHEVTICETSVVASCTFPPGIIGFSLQADGPFTSTITFTIVLDDNGYGRGFFYFKGLEAGETIAEAYSPFFGWFRGMGPVYYTVTEVTHLELLAGEAIVTYDNPDWAGGGYRIFPGKQHPADTAERNKVKLLAVTNPNATVYFRVFDMDDLTTDDAPVDTNGSAGGDNRGALSAVGIIVQAGDDGVAESDFEVSMNPGDNFMFAASCNPSYLTGVRQVGDHLVDADGNTLPTGQGKVTPMLTVWRKLHVEVDSMGIVSGNIIRGIVKSARPNTRNNQTTISVKSLNDYLGNSVKALENNRFEKPGVMLIDTRFDGWQSFWVKKNTRNAVTVDGYVSAIERDRLFELFDDDNFNENVVPPFADNGEDVVSTGNIFSAMQDSSDPTKNVFAPAFIQPKFDGWIATNNTGNIDFSLNVPYDGAAIVTQLNKGIGSFYNESDNFWVVYLQLGYQGDIKYDYDPAKGNVHYGIANGAPLTNDVSNAADVPLGSAGALVYLEPLSDVNRTIGNLPHSRIITAPHEIGHQFGLKGDDRRCRFDLMSGSYCNLLTFVPRHLNVLRWRVKSPGSF